MLWKKKKDLNKEIDNKIIAGDKDTVFKLDLTAPQGGEKEKKEIEANIPRTLSNDKDKKFDNKNDIEEKDEDIVNSLIKSKENEDEKDKKDDEPYEEWGMHISDEILKEIDFYDKLREDRYKKKKKIQMLNADSGEPNVTESVIYEYMNHENMILTNLFNSKVVDGDEEYNELDFSKFFEERYIANKNYHIFKHDKINRITPIVEDKYSDSSRKVVSNLMDQIVKEGKDSNYSHYKAPKKIMNYDGWQQTNTPYYKDTELASFIGSQFNIDCYRYHVAEITEKLIAEAFTKYISREDPDVFAINYNGVQFEPWLMEQLNREIGEFTIPPLDIDLFSEADLTANSKKSFPGLICKNMGIQNKLDKLSETKFMSKVFVSAIHSGLNPIHLWTMITIPKKSKREIDAIRIAFAPEMYFYIPQYLLFKDFCHAMENSNISSKWELFFGNFDLEIRKLRGPKYDSIDMKDFGGRIGPSIFRVFKNFMLKRLQRSSDSIILNYILDDILNSLVVLPNMAGGGIWRTYSGWKDGPYGTIQFDAFAMYVGVCYFFFSNLIKYGADDRLTYQYGPELGWLRHYRCSIHGDNHLSSYEPGLHKYFYPNNPKIWSKLGWELKEITSGTYSEVEFMGFFIKEVEVNGIKTYVGYRPSEKIVRSLIWRRKKFEDDGDNSEYLRQIIACLLINDYWNNVGRNLLIHLQTLYGRPKQITYDSDMENLRAMFESIGLQYGEIQYYWVYGSKFRKGFLTMEDLDL